MEKLIELLNEFDPYIARDGEHRDNLWGYAYRGHSAVFPKELAESYIISKSYGFIKWLVENEKIDTGTRNPLFITELVGEQEKQIPYSFYEEMLIRLALSDTPIEDLISYLK